MPVPKYNKNGESFMQRAYAQTLLTGIYTEVTSTYEKDTP
jgi:hypothetical protein